jgi:Rad3-related DNA helicase
MALNLLDLKYNPKGIEKETKDLMIQSIKQIIEAYPDSKGIIHTGNQKITQIILNAFRGNRRFLCRMEDISNQDIMEEHIHSPLPTILVSSSLMDGADLYDDLSRFQIVVKMPFLSLGDKRVALKSKLYPEWYTAQTWMRLIQACGRSIRSETDTADTYILDKAFAWQFKQALNSRILPRQFVQRVKTK